MHLDDYFVNLVTFRVKKMIKHGMIEGVATL